jgi:hypothetical protein
MLAGIEIIILWLMILNLPQINKLLLFITPILLGKFCCGFKWVFGG